MGIDLSVSDSRQSSAGLPQDFDRSIQKKSSPHPQSIPNDTGAARRYTGDVTPEQAARLIACDAAVLVDVRTAEERKKDGIIPDSLAIAWATGPALIRNPRFLRDLTAKVPADRMVLFICRSGRRSVDAAIAATAQGFCQAYNVLEGIAGADDPGARAAGVIGWAARGLPFVKR